MELRYVGFSHSPTKRIYLFDRVAKGEPTLHISVAADLSLLAKHRIALQEGPALCAQKLTGLTGSRSPDQELTEADLAGYLATRAQAEARKMESRRNAFRRRSTKPGAPPPAPAPRQAAPKRG